METEEIKAVTVRIPVRDYLELERIGKRRKMNQAQVLRMIVNVGIECHKDMENLGLIGVVDLVYFMKEAIKMKSAGKQLVLPMT